MISAEPMTWSAPLAPGTSDNQPDALTHHRRCKILPPRVEPRVAPRLHRHGAPMPPKTTLVFGVLLFAISQAVAQVPGAAPVPILVRAGLLIDPETGTAARNQTVAIANGK